MNFVHLHASPPSEARYMINLTDQSFFIISVLGTIIIVFFILIFVIYFFRPAKEEQERYVFLKTAKKFEKQLEKLMEEELKKTVAALNQNIQTFTNQLTEFYSKEMSFFPIKMEEQFSQLNKMGKMIQDKLLKETENKIAEFDNTYLKGQDLLFQEIKNKTEELSKNITEEIHWLYQASLEPLSEKIVQAEKNIDNYKKEKTEEIDQKIYQIIKQVAKRTIGKTIDLSLHEELVVEALEKAKKEKFFSI